MGRKGGSVACRANPNPPSCTGEEHSPPAPPKKNGEGGYQGRERAPWEGGVWKGARGGGKGEPCTAAGPEGGVRGP